VQSLAGQRMYVHVFDHAGQQAAVIGELGDCDQTGRISGPNDRSRYGRRCSAEIFFYLLLQGLPLRVVMVRR